MSPKDEAEQAPPHCVRLWPPVEERLHVRQNDFWTLGQAVNIGLADMLDFGPDEIQAMNDEYARRPPMKKPVPFVVRKLL